MKIITSLLVLALLLSAGCVRRKAEPQADATNPHAGIDMSKNPHAGMNMDSTNPHAGMDMNNPHAGMNLSGPGSLDLEAMMAKLPDGWTKTQPLSSMRVAQISIAPAKGDAAPAEIAVFHFPGSGGSSAANIERWKSQYAGPGGEPGSAPAKTDTMMVGLLTVVTTDVSGTQLAQSSMMGGAATKDMANYRMIASVIETPSGNWFLKATGPQKTMTANEAKIREFVKRAKVTEGNAHSAGDGHGH